MESNLQTSLSSDSQKEKKYVSSEIKQSKKQNSKSKFQTLLIFYFAVFLDFFSVGLIIPLMPFYVMVILTFDFDLLFWFSNLFKKEIRRRKMAFWTVGNYVWNFSINWKSYFRKIKWYKRKEICFSLFIYRSSNILLYGKNV